ncbi:MAG: NifC-like protein [Thermodesulfobacteriota bacterium]|nr:NifC-like protein [Thermodesulfobacteriota bacterium]
MNRVFLLPLVVLFLFTAGVLSALFFRLSPGEIIAALGSDETRFALRLSLMTSIAATFLALILGVPTGYVLARTDFPGKAILDTFLDLPLVITPLIAGIGLLFLFGQNMLGARLGEWGIHILFTPWGAVLAQTFVASPIVMRSSRAAFERVGPRYEWAAATLGLRPSQIFFRISLPLARQGIMAGTILGWTRAMGEFGATLMVAGAIRFKTETLPIAVYLNISSGDLGTALSCAWVLMATGFAMLLALRWIGQTPRSETLPSR